MTSHRERPSGGDLGQLRPIDVKTLTNGDSLCPGFPGSRHYVLLLIPRGHPCQGRMLYIEVAGIPHGKMEKIASIWRNDGVLPPNWWRENENGFITGNMLFTPKRRQIKLELQSSQYIFCWQGKTKNRSPTKKGKCVKHFQITVFQKKLFFVLCIALNLKDSFINSFSLSFKHLVAFKKKS